jgi:hypothetical protein
VAVIIGVGVSLVLDESALLLHLHDVYWSNEGRVSVDRTADFDRRFRPAQRYWEDAVGGTPSQQDPPAA